jgi:hypothetical protein
MPDPDIPSGQPGPDRGGTVNPELKLHSAILDALKEFPGIDPGPGAAWGWSKFP